MAKTLRLAQDGFKSTNWYSDTPLEHLPALRTLFELLDAGTVPNFMEVWLAISEYVAFSTKDDSISSGPEIPIINMSQKKCRFCA